MSPTLLCLYQNVLLFALPSYVSTPPSPRKSRHAFMDDLLHRSENGDRIQQILNFLDTIAREWTLDLNLTKTEIHVMGAAPPRTFSFPFRHIPVKNRPKNWPATQVLQIFRGVPLHRQPHGTNTGAGQSRDTFVLQNPPAPQSDPFRVCSPRKCTADSPAALPPHGAALKPWRVEGPPSDELAEYCTRPLPGNIQKNIQVRPP